MEVNEIRKSQGELAGRIALIVFIFGLSLSVIAQQPIFLSVAPQLGSLWEPPQWRVQPGPHGNVLVWDGQWRDVTPPKRRAPSSSGSKSSSSSLGKIKRLPKTKSFGGGVTGELIEEEGEEERIVRHTGTNRGRYRLYKYIPGHRDPDTKEWIPGYKEEVGEEEVGQDLYQESGERREWYNRKK